MRVRTGRGGCAHRSPGLGSEMRQGGGFFGTCRGQCGVTRVASTPALTLCLPWAARPRAYFLSADFFLGSACSSCDQMRGTESPTAWDLNLRLRAWRWEEGRRAVRGCSTRSRGPSPAGPVRPTHPGLPPFVTCQRLVRKVGLHNHDCRGGRTCSQGPWRGGHGARAGEGGRAPVMAGAATPGRERLGSGAGPEDTEAAHRNAWTGAGPVDSRGERGQSGRVPPPGFHISITHPARDSRTPARPHARTQGSCPPFLPTLESRPRSPPPSDPGVLAPSSFPGILDFSRWSWL